MLLGETARISCKMQVRYSAFVLLNELIVSFFEKRGRPHFLLLEHITTKFKIQESQKKQSYIRFADHADKSHGIDLRESYLATTQLR